MAKSKFDQNAAFKRIAGISDEAEEQVKTENTSAPEREQRQPKVQEQKPVVKAKKSENEGAYFRITPKHIKAIKMRIAVSERPEDKDKSSIVRAALDAYLKDELKKL